MAEESVLEVIRQYSRRLQDAGICVDRIVVYGSHAKGKPHEWSDIDVVVVAPEFDKPHDMTLIEKLWFAAEATDVRIEPVACGVEEWKTDNGRPILEIARSEGIEAAP
jgi:predicted nucleotidyltransferase